MTAQRNVDFITIGLDPEGSAARYLKSRSARVLVPAKQPEEPPPASRPAARSSATRAVKAERDRRRLVKEVRSVLAQAEAALAADDAERRLLLDGDESRIVLTLEPSRSKARGLPVEYVLEIQVRK